MKKDCWEYKCCGNGENCPACTEKRLDSHNSGTNAGRACWVVAGTLCGGSVQGIFAQGTAGCKECDFYMHVLQEEGPGYINAINLLSHLN
jgi:hypothetical protein